jgi:hypothetical protein
LSLLPFFYPIPEPHNVQLFFRHLKEKNIQIAVSMNIPEEKARKMAETVLPNLERWRL